MGRSVDVKASVIDAAKDLGYSKEVIAKLEAATDEHEIARIMYDARQAAKGPTAVKKRRTYE